MDTVSLEGIAKERGLGDSETVGHIAEAAEIHIAAVEDDSGRQNIEVVRLPADESQATFIIPAVWSDYPSRRFNLLRQAEAARASGAEVFILGIPGTAFSSGKEVSELTPRQREDLTDEEPSLRSVSEKLWDAIYGAVASAHGGITADEYFSNRRLSMLGYSQGVSILAGMQATRPEGIGIHKVAYVEMADQLEAVSLANIFGRFAIDLLSFRKYLQENKRYFPDLYEAHSIPEVSDFIRRLAKEDSLIIMPRVFAKSSVERDIRFASDEGLLKEDTVHNIRRGTNSKVATQKAARKLYQLLGKQAKAHVDGREYSGDNHGLQESLIRYGAAAVEIAGS